MARLSRLIFINDKKVYLIHLYRNQESVNLTGSLLDFADDLYPDDDDEYDGSKFKDSLEPSSDEEESNLSIVEIRC